MDDNAKMVLKVAIIGVAVYFGYRYLQSSGLWAQWFPSSALPPAPAPQPNAPAPVASPPVTALAPVSTPVSLAVPTASQLQIQLAAQSTDLHSSDEWCWAYQKVTGSACPGNSVVGPAMTAAQFVTALQNYNSSGGQTQNVGLSGLGFPRVSAYSKAPYRWVSTKVQ